jgi:hypothetical protein
MPLGQRYGSLCPYSRFVEFVIPCYQCLLIFIIFLIFADFRGVNYCSYCFININNTLLMRCHSFVEVSDFLRN